MSDVQYITVKPLSGISPEQARDARARAWAFVFDCWQRKAAGTNTSKGGSKCSHVTKGDQCDLEKRAFLAQKMTEQIGKDKHGFVHR